MLFENHRLITDTKQVADVFNRYFTEIDQGIGFNDPIPHDYYEKSTMATLISKYDSHPSVIAIKQIISSGQNFNFRNVAPFEIYHMLIKMNEKKATGFDEISSKFLKIGATPLAGPISRLINLSILIEIGPPLEGDDYSLLPRDIYFNIAHNVGGGGGGGGGKVVMN